MAYEVTLKGTFITGTSADTRELAIKQTNDLLIEMLEQGQVSGIDGIFFWKLDSIEAERL